MVTKDQIEAQIEELIRTGIFRDLRCPKWRSCWVDTISVFGELGRHRYLACKTEFTDEDLEEEKGSETT